MKLRAIIGILTMISTIVVAQISEKQIQTGNLLEKYDIRFQQSLIVEVTSLITDQEFDYLYECTKHLQFNTEDNDVEFTLLCHYDYGMIIKTHQQDHNEIQIYLVNCTDIKNFEQFKNQDEKVVETNTKKKFLGTLKVNQELKLLLKKFNCQPIQYLSTSLDVSIYTRLSKWLMYKRTLQDGNCDPNQDSSCGSLSTNSIILIVCGSIFGGVYLLMVVVYVMTAIEKNKQTQKNKKEREIKQAEKDLRHAMRREQGLNSHSDIELETNKNFGIFGGAEYGNENAEEEDESEDEQDEEKGDSDKLRREDRKNVDDSEDANDMMSEELDLDDSDSAEPEIDRTKVTANKTTKIAPPLLTKAGLVVAKQLTKKSKELTSKPSTSQGSNQENKQNSQSKTTRQIAKDQQSANDFSPRAKQQSFPSQTERKKTNSKQDDNKKKKTIKESKSKSGTHNRRKNYEQSEVDIEEII